MRASLLISTVFLLGVSLAGCGLDRFGISPATDASYYDNGSPETAEVELGRKLFFDKILSGNQNISCATCHHPLLGTGDGLSLGVGEGGVGLGIARTTGTGADAIDHRIPRNAPPLFNIGAVEYVTMFHDGRVQVDSSFANGFRNPAAENLPSGLDNVLAVQAMFPVTSAEEMAGANGENPIATLAAAGNLVGVWNALADRVRAVGEYATLFQDVYGVASADITYVHIANAIAAYEAKFWRSDNSPFDAYLRGDDSALSETAMAGAELFYGDAQCGRCHSGTFQTDHQFHSIAMPQIGPGKGDGVSGKDDFGRGRVTGEMGDRYNFRTPSLRNVVLTGPWGHNGAYNTLEGIIRQHLTPYDSLVNYDETQAVLPSRADLDAEDFELLDGEDRRQSVLSSADVATLSLSDEQITELIEFLKALTDPDMVDMRDDIPDSVPSGLPVHD